MRLNTTNLGGYLLTFLCICSVASSEEPAAKDRRYDLGPLTIGEFVGQVEHSNSAQANTATRVRSNFRYTVRQFGRQFQASITSFELYAVFLPSDSWWGPHAGAELLDHEQGHFDIAEINVKKAELAIAQSKADGTRITVTKASKHEATAEVIAKLNEILSLVDQQTAQDNLEYDRETRHGFDVSTQAERRRIQQLTLDRLTEDLDSLNPSSRSRRLRSALAPK